MKLSRQIKPITYLKANAAEMVRGVAEKHEPYVITQNGEARAVLQDIRSWEQTQETLALLRILALGAEQIEQGRTQPLKKVTARIRERKASRSDAI